MDERRKGVIHRVALAGLLLFAYGYFLPPSSPERFGTNNSVRFYLTKSLVRDGSFHIEKYYTGGIDAAYFGGHYYSGKAPAASFLAAPVYWLVYGAGFREIPDWVYLYIVQLAVISIPSVILALLLHGFIIKAGCPDTFADLLVIGYSLGTMAFPYSTQFMGHQLAAVFLFGCFLLLSSTPTPRHPDAPLRPHAPLPTSTPSFRVRPYAPRPTPTSSPELFSVTRPYAPRPTPTHFLLAGLLAGMAVAADYQVAAVVLIVFAFMVLSANISGMLLFAAGCLPGAFFILLYNYTCFGSILSFPYAHEAMPIAREVQSQGLFGIMFPRLIPFAKLLFSPWRGLFFGSPFLLLMLPGLCCLKKPVFRNEDRTGLSARKLFWTCLLIPLCYVLINSSYEAWSGGAGYGPRFLVPVIPFCIVPIGILMAGRPKGYGVLLAVLVAYSVAFHVVGASAGPLAHEYLRNPVGEFLLPSFLRGNVRPNWATLLGCPAGASLVLFILVIAIGIWKSIATARPDGIPSPLRPGERVLLWVCALAAACMVALFFLHRTEETGYRYAVVGHSYDLAGDQERAISFFEKSLTMDPVNPLVLGDLSRILIDRGEYRRALDLNIRALSASQAPRDLGLRCRMLAAVVEITESVDVSASPAALYMRRADILERLGCHEAARRDRERGGVAKDR